MGSKRPLESETKAGGRPPLRTDDQEFGSRQMKPKRKGKSPKSAALDTTASPGLDDLDKEA